MKTGNEEPRHILVCFGTRPEAIKLAPVVEALQSHSDLVPVTVAVGQHREMLRSVLGVLGITVDIDLGLMRDNQPMAEFCGRALIEVGRLVHAVGPAAVVVQGDTATTLACALAGFYANVPVAHVEAGLRTGDRANPFPEEAHRCAVTPLASWHFCPTARNAAAVLREGADPERVEVTGNTVVEAVQRFAEKPLPAHLALAIPPRMHPRRALVTLHRRETIGSTQQRLFEAIADTARRYARNLDVLVPLHMNPRVRASAGALSGVENVRVIEPLDYHSFIHVLKDSDLVITDSGGIQEEAPTFGVPTLVARETTERIEGIEAGCARLVGTDPRRVAAQIDELLNDEAAYARMAAPSRPYGDGSASARIVERLCRDLNRRSVCATSSGVGPWAYAAGSEVAATVPSRR